VQEHIWIVGQCNIIDYIAGGEGAGSQIGSRQDGAGGGGEVPEDF